jgi:hypothetical protein
MIMCNLKNQGLWGCIEVYNYSYIVRVYPESIFFGPDAPSPAPIYVMSFGNGVDAENRLIELLEHPAWTVLKHG